MNVDCFDRIINIIATIGTAGSAIAAVWLGLRGDRCRVDGIFLWDSSTEYKPILWIRNISNRIAVLEYVEIYYDRILKKRLDFSKEYSLKNYAIVRANDTVENDIVMAVTSENVEDVCSCTAWLGNEPIAVSGHTAIIHHNQNPKFLSYYFRTAHFFAQKRKLAHGTKVMEVTPDKLNDILIPLPSIEEQERIVVMLDRFDSLCNDISAGLPAEIEARQKQYEYYRDKLLTFKEMSV